jgi:SAM-dependent methyltransferase
MHELDHATFNTLGTVNIPVSFDNNEAHCYLLGYYAEWVERQLIKGETMNYEKLYNALYTRAGYYEKTPDLTNAESLLPFLSEDNKDKRILEIGCGKGALLPILESKGFKNENIFSMDVAEKAVLHTRRRGFNCTHGTLLHLGAYFKESSMDFIISSDVLEHIEPSDINTAFDEMYFVMRGGGKLLIKICLNAEVERQYLQKLKEINCQWAGLDNLHRTIKSADYWKEKLDTAGFKVEKEKITTRHYSAILKCV